MVQFDLSDLTGEKEPLIRAVFSALIGADQRNGVSGSGVPSPGKMNRLSRDQ